MSEAAGALKVNRRDLYREVDELGIDPKQFRTKDEAGSKTL